MNEVVVDIVEALVGVIEALVVGGINEDGIGLEIIEEEDFDFVIFGIPCS